MLQLQYKKNIETYLSVLDCKLVTLDSFLPFYNLKIQVVTDKNSTLEKPQYIYSYHIYP